MVVRILTGPISDVRQSRPLPGAPILITLTSGESDRMKIPVTDRLPHVAACVLRIMRRWWCTSLARASARWWHVTLGKACWFDGVPVFRRHPGSSITIGDRCGFNSHHGGNLAGLNRRCQLSTLSQGAEITIGADSGLSGTVIGCQMRINIGARVRCGANTLITDTDWHSDDPRAGAPAAVTIEDDVWLGINVVVLKGVTVGHGSLVGANSVVTSDIPAGVVAAGNPACVIRELAAEPQSSN